MIRRAWPADAPEMVKMGSEFWHLSPWAIHAPFDAAAFGANLLSWIEAPYALVLTDGEACMSVAMLCSLYANPNFTVCQELFWWVAPHARGKLGFDLMEAMEREAAVSGADLMQVGATEAMRPEAVGRLYERHGYSLSDRTYTKAL